MKKTRRFVALLLAAVLALALFTACGAAEQPQQSAIGKVYEDWFVEKLNSNRPAEKPVQKVECPEMRAALAKIGKDGKFKAGDGWNEYVPGYGLGKKWYWLIISNPRAWNDTVSKDSTVDAVVLTPENLTNYGPGYFILSKDLYRIDEYDIATRVMDGNTYVAVYVCLEKKPS